MFFVVMTTSQDYNIGEQIIGMNHNYLFTSAIGNLLIECYCPILSEFHTTKA